MMIMMIITTQIYFISDVFGSVPIVVALTFLYHRNGVCNVSKRLSGALKNKLLCNISSWTGSRWRWISSKKPRYQWHIRFQSLDCYFRLTQLSLWIKALIRFGCWARLSKWKWIDLIPLNFISKCSHLKIEEGLEQRFEGLATFNFYRRV